MFAPLVSIVLFILTQLTNLVNCQSSEPGQQATAYFLWSIKSYATLDATYQLARTLSSFIPPDDCTAFLENGATTFSSLGIVRSHYSVGCVDWSPSSCCPPNWSDVAYYTGGQGSCPPGYQKLMQTTQGLTLTVGRTTYRDDGLLISGSATARPCCPSLTYTNSRGRTYSVPYDAAMEPLLVTKDGVEQTRIECSYDSIPFREVTTESGTEYTVYHVYRGFPLYIFDDATVTPQPTSATQMTSTEASSSTAHPEQTISSQVTPTDKPATANRDGSEKPSGLSTAAIVGIAVGVGVPVVFAIIFVTWCLTRRCKTPVAATEPRFSNNYFAEVDVPEVHEVPANYLTRR
ncbi:hypothetical protein TWF281_003204 [Arthrobotrys megalospora]